MAGEQELDMQCALSTPLLDVELASVATRPECRSSASWPLAVSQAKLRKHCSDDSALPRLGFDIEEGRSRGDTGAFFGAPSLSQSDGSSSVPTLECAIGLFPPVDVEMGDLTSLELARGKDSDETEIRSAGSGSITMVPTGDVLSYTTVCSETPTTDAEDPVTIRGSKKNMMRSTTSDEGGRRSPASALRRDHLRLSLAVPMDTTMSACWSCPPSSLDARKTRKELMETSCSVMLLHALKDFGPRAVVPCKADCHAPLRRSDLSLFPYHEDSASEIVSGKGCRSCLTFLVGTTGLVVALFFLHELSMQEGMETTAVRFVPVWTVAFSALLVERCAKSPGPIARSLLNWLVIFWSVCCVCGSPMVFVDMWGLKQDEVLQFGCEMAANVGLAVLSVLCLRTPVRYDGLEKEMVYCLLWMWLASLIQLQNVFLNLSWHGGKDRDPLELKLLMVSKQVSRTTGGALWASLWWAAWLMLKRVGFVLARCRASRYETALRWLTLLEFMLQLAELTSDVRYFETYFAKVYILVSVCAVARLFLVYWALSEPRRTLRRRCERMMGSQRGAAIWASSVFRRECVLSVAFQVSWVIVLMLRYSGQDDTKDIPTDLEKQYDRLVLSTLDVAPPLLLALVGGTVLSGMSGGIPMPLHKAPEPVPPRGIPRAEGLPTRDASKRPHRSGKEDGGLTLEQIIDFYSACSKEADFDPARTTTEQAIGKAISRMAFSEDAAKKGASVADGLGSRCSSKSDTTFVTHAPGMVFSHLVAAMLADALAQPVYKPLALLLEGGRITHLKDLIRRRGKLRKVFWVTSLCLSHHVLDEVGVADDSAVMVRRRTDADNFDSSRAAKRMATGRGRVFQVLSYFRQHCRNASQLVVLDAEFSALDDTWFVAETMEADSLGLPQRVQLLCNAAVRDHYDILTFLPFEFTSGATAEAKAYLVDEIPDLTVFNKRLQWLFYGTNGLMAQHLCFEHYLRKAAKVYTLIEHMAAAAAFSRSAPPSARASLIHASGSSSDPRRAPSFRRRILDGKGRRGSAVSRLSARRLRSSQGMDHAAPDSGSPVRPRQHSSTQGPALSRATTADDPPSEHHSSSAHLSLSRATTADDPPSEHSSGRADAVGAEAASSRAGRVAEGTPQQPSRRGSARICETRGSGVKPEVMQKASPERLGLSDASAQAGVVCQLSKR